MASASIPPAQTPGLKQDCAVNPDAVDRLYRGFFLRLVRRVEWRFRLTREDAIEVVQDAFVLALTRLDEERNPKSWIYAVVDRLAANWKRKVIRRTLLLARWQPSSRTESGTHRDGERREPGEDY